MPQNSYKLPFSFLFAGQLQHILILILLVSGAYYLAEPVFDDGSWLGIQEQTWFSLGMGIVIAHQVIVWFVFRTQLMYSLLTRLLGKLALPVWGIIFMPFLLARLLLVLAIGLADAGSMPELRWLQILFGSMLMLPAIYSMHSVLKYFGIKRALGGDHFYQKYREMPLVKKGVFKFTSNAMYALVFLSLWAIALFTGSRAALSFALFQHAYIWVHMYSTEQPDMQVLYG